MENKISLPPEYPLELDGVKYIIKGFLGHGGSSIVYRAMSEEGPVIIKELFPDNLKGKITRKNFDKGNMALVIPSECEEIMTIYADRAKAEARFARELRNLEDDTVSPWIAPYKEPINANETFYTVIGNSFAGETLEEMMCCKNGDTSLRSFVDICDQILRILEVLMPLHEHPKGAYLHLDIAPDNIFVLNSKFDEKRITNLIDFNSVYKMGTLEESDRRFSQKGYYSAPEIEALRGTTDSAARDLKKSADLYSVAVIFFELLMGRPPEPRDRVAWSRGENIFETANNSYEIIEDMVPAVREKANEVLKKGLCIIADQRYKNIKKLRIAIDELRRLQRTQKVKSRINDALSECVDKMSEGQLLVLDNMSNKWAPTFEITNEDKDIFVFSVYTEKTRFCALDVDAKYHGKAYSIFCGINTPNGINENFAHDFPHSGYYDDIAKINVPMKADRRVYFLNISENEDENLYNTLALIERYVGSEYENNINIITFIRNISNTERIDDIDKGHLNIRLVDEVQAHIYALLDKTPLYTATKNGSVNLLIIGFDDYGEEMLKAALWCGQIEGISLIINVLTNDAEFKKVNLSATCPELLSGDYNINFYETELDIASLENVIRERFMDTSYMVVASDSEVENDKITSHFRRFFLRIDHRHENMPVIAARISNVVKYENIRTIESNKKRTSRSDICYFGNYKEIYSYGELIASPIENLAKNVHLLYSETHKRLTGSSEFIIPPALAEYNLFEVKKRSSRACAMHIRYKLWLIGLDYTDTDNEEEVSFADHYDENMLRCLAKMEHDRWVAFKRTEGWKSTDADMAIEPWYRELSEGRHENHDLKFHPYICTFEEMVERSNIMGLPDAMLYDIELIKRIPDILNDHWGVTGRKYKIIKRAM